MENVLKQYAIEEAWCSPDQDNQAILAAQRITKDGGAIVTAQVLTRRITLPDPKKYYHLYSIGQIFPSVLGLLNTDPSWAIQGWRKLTDTVNEQPIYCDVYVDNGVKIPLDRVFYQYTPDRTLVFCVEILKPGLLDVDFNTDQLYFRFYTNAFYDSIEGNSYVTNTRAISKVILNNADILEVQSIEAQWKSLGTGAVFSYVNGHLVNALTMFTVKIGDLVECVVDASVKKVVDFDLDTLRTFSSLRDLNYKYLLHPVKSGMNIIDYADDVEVYLIARKDNGNTFGRYLHRNLKSSMRMVTHRDYAVAVSHVADLKHKLTEYIGLLEAASSKFYLRLYIRNSGLFKTLPYENNRLADLYKLSDDEIVNAMLGADATVPFWKAAELENSAFSKLLDAPYASIGGTMIENAFGYNAISKFLADTPLYKNPEFGSSPVFTLPPGLMTNSTIYEYNANGELLTWSSHDNSSTHIATDPNCVFIEGIVGKGSEEPDVIYGTDNLAIDTRYNYRVYMAYGTADAPTTPWRDITGTDLYAIENGVLKWASPDQDYILMVRSNKGFLAYDLDLTAVAGTFYFTLAEISGGLHRTMPVPGGELDIWLNKKRLIRGLDYVVDFPKVVIFNKDYLVQPAGSTVQKVTVRFTDFPAPGPDGYILDPVGNWGFIEHGFLSNDNRYNIRDDKVVSISVKGCLKHRSAVLFSEDHEGVSIINTLNGQPYQVSERFIPFLGLTPTNAEILRVESGQRDKAVEDFMSVKYPQPPREALSSIQQRHRLFSPFFSHLINDLASGQFTHEQLHTKMTDQAVLDICKPYEYLLENDPLNEKFHLDYRLVLIHPHQLDMTLLLDVESYAFMKHVVKLYGKNLISLSGHLNINTGD